MAIVTQNIGKPNLQDVVAKLDTVTGVMTISGTGETIGDTTFSGVFLFPNHYQFVRKIIVEEGITRIGDFLFAKQGKYPLEQPEGKYQDCILESITFPDSLLVFSTYITYGVCVNGYISIGPNTKPSPNFQEQYLVSHAICPKVIIRKNRPANYQEIINYSYNDLLMYLTLTVWNDTIIDSTGKYAYHEENGKVFFEGFTKSLAELDDIYNAPKEITIPDVIDGKKVIGIDNLLQGVFNLNSAKLDLVINIGKSVEVIREFAFEFFKTIFIKIDVPKGSIQGEPWGAVESHVLYRGEKTPLSLNVTKPMTNNIFYSDEEVSLRDIEISASYEDGTSEIVTSKCTTTFYSDEICFKYINLEVRHPIISYTVLALIVTPPTKTIYLLNEPLDTTGMKVEVRVKEGAIEKTIVADNYQITGFNSTVEGINNVTISFHGVSNSFPVTIKSKIITSLEIMPPSKVEYKKGETFDASGLVVKAVYSNGQKEIVTNYTLSGYDANTIGQQTITVEYEGITGTFIVNVVYNPVDEFLNTTQGMQVLLSNPKSVIEYIFPIKGVHWFKYAARNADKIYVSCDGWIGFGKPEEQFGLYNVIAYINSNKGGLSAIYRQEGTFSTGRKFLKLRIEGYISRVNASDIESYSYIYELFLIDGQTLFLNIIKRPSSHWIKPKEAYIYDGFSKDLLWRKVPSTTNQILVENAGICQNIVSGSYIDYSITSLEITSLPKKTTYLQKEQFDKNGLVVKLVDQAGKKTEIYDYSLIGFDSSKPANKEISVLYRNSSNKFNVTVVASDILEITSLPNKLQYKNNEPFDKNGLTVTLVHTNSTREDVTNLCTISQPDMTLPGVQAVIVTYNNLIVSFFIENISDYIIKNIGYPVESDVTGTYIKRTEEVIVTGKGAIKDFASDNTLLQYLCPYRPKLSALYIDNGITKIGKYATASYSSDIWLEKTYLAMSVIDGTLYDSNSEIPIPFARAIKKPNNEALVVNAREYVVPEGIKKIGNSFDIEVCTVYLPEGITELTDIASFNISEINFPPSLTTVPDKAFNQNFIDEIWVQSIEIIPNHAFASSVYAKKIYLSSKVKQLNVGAFSNCTALEELVLPKSIIKMNFNINSTDRSPISGLTSLKKIYFLNPNLQDILLTKVNGLTIYGFNNSTAQTYATQNGINFIDLGTFQSLQLMKAPDKVKYKVGELFDEKGMILKAIYSSGESVVVPPDSVTGFDNLTTGIKHLTISYENQSVSLDVQIVNCTGIEITRLPLKTEYLKGELFNEEGLIVSEVYSDGTKAETKGFSLSGYDRNKFGNQVIDVSYNGHKSNFPVSVSYDKSPTGIVVSKMPEKTQFKTIDTFSTHGIEVDLICGDGTKKRINNVDLTFQGFDAKKIGVNKITIFYNNFVTSYNVDVIPPASISINERYGKTNYFFVGDTNTGDYAYKVKSILATWDDGTKKILLEKDFTESPVDTSKPGNFYTILSYAGLEIKSDYIVYGGIFTANVGTPRREDVVFSINIDTGETSIIGKGKHVIGAVDIPNSWARRTKSLVLGEGISDFPDYKFHYVTYIKVPSTFTSITNADMNRILSSYSTAVLDINHKKNFFPGAPWGIPELTTIWSAKPQELKITKQPSKNKFVEGDVFDHSGIECKMLYSNKLLYSTDTAPTFSQPDMSKIGIQPITVSCLEEGKTYSTSYMIEVVKEVTGIKILKYPSKKYYKIGESLDVSGIEVAKIGGDYTMSTITNYQLSGFDSNTPGNKVINISYTYKTNIFNTSFTVIVTKDGINPFEDNTEPIKILVHFLDGNFQDLTNEHIQSGSMKLQESICAENYFIFGGCVSNQITFKVHHPQFIGTDENSYPSGRIQVHLEKKGIDVILFTGEIASGERDAGMLTRTIIAYDYLYKWRNTDIVWWYKNLTVDKKIMVTQKQFRDDLFKYLGIEQVPTKLYYDDAYVPDTNISNEINAVNVLKDLCLQNSVFGWMNKEGKFEYLDLKENSRIQALTVDNKKIFGYFDSKIHIDKFKSFRAKEGIIWYPRQFYTIPYPGTFHSSELTAQEAYEKNVYYNRNSFFVGNQDWLDGAFQADEYGIYTLMQPLFPICYGTRTFTDEKYFYRAQEYTVEVIGNPFNMVGDTIEMSTTRFAEDGTEIIWKVHSYIMSRTLQIGATMLLDTYSAKNNPYNGNNRQEGKNTAEFSAELFRQRSERPYISYAEFTDGTGEFTPATVAASSLQPKKSALRCMKRIKKADYDALEKKRTDTLYFTFEEV